jgi:hypothetical protein
MGLTYFGGATVPSVTQQISDIKTASAIIYTGLCGLGGIIIRTNKVVDVTLNIYDGIDNTGKLVSLPDLVLKRKANNNIWTLNYSPAIECINGIYVEATVPIGGAIDYQVVYEEG